MSGFQDQTDHDRRLAEGFRAFRVHLDEGQLRRGVETLTGDELPAGEVTIAVSYSALNYKDALSAGGHKGVSRNYPHTPGIDAAGRVVASSSARYTAGDEVLVTGYDLGMNTPGGWSEYIRVPAEWLVPLPAGLSLRSAMALGTAGLTAALAVARLASVGLQPSAGPVVVTGASGGVGTMSVALLAAAGFEVIAVSGKPDAAPLLQRLGAGSVLAREELSAAAERPLLSAEFAGGIDTVGGTTLANLLKRIKPHGAVAACGLVGGAELETTVYPFILRGVALLGVDSVAVDNERRRELWVSLAEAWRARGLDELDELVSEVGLEELESAVADILRGAVRGRLVVRLAP